MEPDAGADPRHAVAGMHEVRHFAITGSRGARVRNTVEEFDRSPASAEAYVAAIALISQDHQIDR